MATMSAFLIQQDDTRRALESAIRRETQDSVVVLARAAYLLSQELTDMIVDTFPWVDQ